MLINGALATDTGIKLSLYGGLLAYSAGAVLQNGSLVTGAIQSIPGIGNMMLRYGPQINYFGYGVISAITPSFPDIPLNKYEALGNVIGSIIDYLGED